MEFPPGHKDTMVLKELIFNNILLETGEIRLGEGDPSLRSG